MASTRRRIGLLGALSAVLCTIAAGGGGSTGVAGSPSPSPTATAAATPTLDAAALAREYVTELTRDLGPIQSVDAACASSVAACGQALNGQAALAAKAQADLQNLPAEPDAILQPIEDIRRGVRFIQAIAQDFAAGGMPLDEAIHADDAEYNGIVRTLAALQARR